MAESVELAFEHVTEPGRGEAERRVLFLHGILGSGANLRTIARRFLAERPSWDGWLVDLRGHGDSPKGTPGASLEAAANDVRELCAFSLPVGAIVGHSFGGKVALELARGGFGEILSRDGKSVLPLSHVVTLDSNPGTRSAPQAPDSALAVIDMLETLPARFASRAEFIAAVTARGMTRGLAQWLAMSVQVDPEKGVRFALHLDEIRQLLDSYFAADLWPTVDSPPSGVSVHLVIGEKSGAYSTQDRKRAQQIAARRHDVTVDFLQTGHWVHSEDPEGVVKILLARIGDKA